MCWYATADHIKACARSSKTKTKRKSFCSFRALVPFPPLSHCSYMTLWHALANVKNSLLSIHYSPTAITKKSIYQIIHTSDPSQSHTDHTNPSCLHLLQHSKVQNLSSQGWDIFMNSKHKWKMFKIYFTHSNLSQSSGHTISSIYKKQHSCFIILCPPQLIDCIDLFQSRN